MGSPTKRQLLQAVARMQRVTQQMYAAYANDVSPDRAKRMEELYREGDKIAQPLIDAFPYEYLDPSHAQ